MFDAMQRKETFATSGPHIKVRFFGGWEYAADDADEPRTGSRPATRRACRWAAICRPPNGKAPTFMVWAVKDPTSGNLDRIQIVKGWTKSGQSFEKIFDVVWAGDRKPDKWTGRVPPIGSTVDIENATYTNTIGAVELKTVWTDPEFDPSLDAFYYARVLEIPTPRWTTIQAKQLGIAPPDVVRRDGPGARLGLADLVHAERRGAQERQAAGLTVADLKKQGRRALDDAQLKALIVGKSVWLRNNVTGDVRSQVALRHSGRPGADRDHVGTQAGADMPSEFGRRRRAERLPRRVPGPYTIKQREASSPRSATRRSRWPSTRWATSTSPRAATSSATPTTRSSRTSVDGPEARWSRRGAGIAAHRRLSGLDARTMRRAGSLAVPRLLREPLVAVRRSGCCLRRRHRRAERAAARPNRSS